MLSYPTAHSSPHEFCAATLARLPPAEQSTVPLFSSKAARITRRCSLAGLDPKCNSTLDKSDGVAPASAPGVKWTQAEGIGLYYLPPPKLWVAGMQNAKGLVQWNMHPHHAFNRSLRRLSSCPSPPPPPPPNRRHQLAHPLSLLPPAPPASREKRSMQRKTPTSSQSPPLCEPPRPARVHDACMLTHGYPHLHRYAARQLATLCHPGRLDKHIR
jgi:hypothetical protein